MSFVSFRTYYRAKENGKTSMDYTSLLPKKLTLDPSYISRQFSLRNIDDWVDRHFRTGYKDHTTLFKEVSIVPAEEIITEEMHSVFNEKIGTVKINREHFLKCLQLELEQVVEHNWKPNIAHAIFHSSGLDSRMLSWTIRSLYKKYGDDWLGKVLFMCTKFEAPEFKKIMQFEGWEPSQYFILDENVPDEEYFAENILDFKNAWREHNGVSDVPKDVCYYLPKKAQDKGLLPEHIQLWTGYGGNNLVSRANNTGGGKAVEEEFRDAYLSYIGSRPWKGDEVIMPFLDTDYLKLLINSSVRLGHSIRPELIKSMSKPLSKFVNLNNKHLVKKPVSERLMAQVLKDYKNSWYGKEIHPETKPKYKTTDYQPFWGHWTAASLCEYLLENDYAINIKS